MIKIETDRLVLREWNTNDAKFLFQLNIDPGSDTLHRRCCF